MRALEQFRIGTSPGNLTAAETAFCDVLRVGLDSVDDTSTVVYYPRAQVSGIEARIALPQQIGEVHKTRKPPRHSPWRLHVT